MRDYGIVSPRFWIGETGRKLRKLPDAQRIAMYLLTAPMADMTGVFYCPVATILNDVGAPCEPLEAPLKGLERDYEGAPKGLIRASEGPSKGLPSPSEGASDPLARGVQGASKGYEPPLEGHQRDLEGVKRALLALQALGFCYYDFESEYVFVIEMARWQIAPKLKPSDNRSKGLRKTVENMPNPMRARFIERYNKDFSLGFDEGIEEKSASPLEAPSEPLRSQEQEQEQEQDINKNLSDERFSSDSPALALDGESDAPKRAPGIPMQKIVETYNAKLGSTLGVCRQLNAQRKGNLRQRWADISRIVESSDPKEVLEGFAAFYDKIGRSNFLMGRAADFKATFDWIHNSTNFLKIYEGNYENGRKR